MAGRIGLISLGCAKNLVNSEQMMFLLQKAGFEVSGQTDGADAVVVNTCGFIDSAKSEAIDTILELGAMKEEGLIGKIVVAGCLTQRYKDEIMTELPEIDAIVGTGGFDDIVSVVNSALNGGKTEVFSDISAPLSDTERVITTSKLWTYLKIAEGCDNRCAFCVIPDIRGKFRSRSMESIIDEAENLAGRGIKELIIVAQDVTRYGTDIYGKGSLAPLLERLSGIDGIKWIRLHYLYPDEIDEILIQTIAKNDKILKYLDIPIQHINDDILRNMRRRGSGGEIRELFKRLRREIPNVVLRTSLITGLPGETETEFEELCGFLREAKIERAGVFPYSPEEGTLAFGMERPDEETAVMRAEQVMALQQRIMDEYNESRIGDTITVLIEGLESAGEYYGRSAAESPGIDGVVRVTSAKTALNDFVTVRITGVADGEPVGEVVSDAKDEYGK